MLLQKKKMLLITGLGASGILWGAFLQGNICDFQSGCWDLTQFFIGCAFLFAPAFLFSIVMFWFEYDVYQRWSKFVYFWIPLSIILLLLASNSNGGFVFPSDRELIVLYLPIIFSVISVLLISVTVLFRKRS